MCVPDWLCWPGWAGVSGLVALVALVAAIVIGLRQVFWARRDASFTYTEVHLGGLDASGMQHAKAVLSACGPATLFELDATLVIQGEDEVALGATVPFLSVRGDPKEYAFKIRPDRVADYRLIFEWIEGGPREAWGGLRRGLDDSDPAQVWAYWGWPFQGNGHWKEMSRGKNGKPVGVDRTPPSPHRD